MPETTQPPEQPHRNHGLFSDHYLNVTLAERPGWRDLAEQARPVMEEVALLAAHRVRRREAGPEARSLRRARRARRRRLRGGGSQAPSEERRPAHPSRAQESEIRLRGGGDARARGPCRGLGT